VGRKKTVKPTAIPSVFPWKKESKVKWKAPTRIIIIIIIIIMIMIMIMIIIIIIIFV